MVLYLTAQLKHSHPLTPRELDLLTWPQAMPHGMSPLFSIIQKEQ